MKSKTGSAFLLTLRVVVIIIIITDVFTVLRLTTDIGLFKKFPLVPKSYLGFSPLFLLLAGLGLVIFYKGWDRGLGVISVACSLVWTGLLLYMLSLC